MSSEAQKIVKPLLKDSYSGFEQTGSIGYTLPSADIRINVVPGDIVLYNSMLMYDQDKTMVVSENLGNVIFVKKFEDFIKETGFSIYLCKGYDPETKGKVEKTVEFVKHQFLDGRTYYGLDRLNCEFIDRLERDGNGLINDATKRVPTITLREYL